MANPNPFSVVMRRKLDGQGKRDTVMATPEDVDKKIDSQDDSTQVPLSETQQLDGKSESLDQPTNDDSPTNTKEDAVQLDTREESTGNGQEGEGSSEDVGVEKQVSSAVDSPDQNVDSTTFEPENTTHGQDHTSNTSVRFTNGIQLTPQEPQTTEQPGETEPPTTDNPPDPAAQNDGNNTGDSTPVLLDGTSTPPTPRSTPAKPSVFKKAVPIQKISLNKEFLKNHTPPNTNQQSPATTPRPMANEKRTVPHITGSHLILAKAPSSATKALKPMVRINRLGNMGGAANMQRQGSGSSTPKSGRGTSPNFGRPGSGSDVWNWRRQPAAQREYSEEELQRQGVHLTARLTGSQDEGNKWADMDDDWSDEEVVEEPKEDLESSHPTQQENHIDQPPMLPPHLLESAALGRMPDKPEETVIVSKNERFADVTYDRRDSRSPDENIHGQRQIYNPKLGRFEMVEHQTGRDTERQSRKNVEIMQRGPPVRRGSSAGRRRDSLAKPDEVRQSRGYPDNRGYSPSTQRRPSFVEQRDPHRRRDSFISTSGVSEADRSMSNASPGLESQPPPETAPIDLIALQTEKMADSRKRAQERRAEDELARLAVKERARKKAEQLALMASSETKSDTSKASPTSSIASPVPPKVSPVPAKVSPVPPRASPLPPKASPLVPKASPVAAVVEPAASSSENQSKPPLLRADSALWTTNREQEEIIRNESPSKEESQQKRSAWGAIGPQKAPTHKHQQNGLFGNPNTLAALNHTIGGENTRRGRNAPRPARGPITPTNVPPSLQGWAAFAGSVETRKAHDDERQQERNQERERMERERSANGQKSTSLIDKWKRVEIKEPETAGDVAGRTVVSVLKSGYVEDSSGNLEVTQLSVEKTRSETGVTSPSMSSVLPDAKSPVLGSTTQSLGMQTPTQSALDKTPGSRDRSRFFPSPSSTVVDMSPRVVHPIQPSQPDKSVFPQSLFSSFEDLAKSPPSSTAAISPLHGTSAPPFSSNSQGPQRQHMPPFAQHGQGITSPGQTLAAAPHIGGLTPRSAFSHTLPATSPPMPPNTYKTKLPSVEDFETVLARLRQTMQTNQQPAAQNEDIPPFTPLDSLDSQIQTRTTSIPNETDMQTYLKISAISPNRDLEISTRDLDDEPLPKPTVKVSLPKMLYTSSRDMDLPIDTRPSVRPTIKLPTLVASHADTPDAKSRLIAIDHDFPAQTHQRGHHSRPPSAFKIQFAEALRPHGGVVPNLIKRDKNNDPYINFEAKPEALTLPAYGHDNDVFYPQRPHDKTPAKHKFNKFNKNQPHHRKHPKSDNREGSSSSAGGGGGTGVAVQGSSRGGSVPPEKK